MFTGDPTSVVEERTSSLSLPIKIHHIGCYGNEERLINCTHKVYKKLFFFYSIFGVDTPQPEIVSIKCSDDITGTPVIETTTPCANCSDETPSVTVTSSTINDSQSTVVAAIVLVVLCFSVVIGLVIGYIIFKYIQRQKGRFVLVWQLHGLYLMQSCSYCIYICG